MLLVSDIHPKPIINSKDTQQHTGFKNNIILKGYELRSQLYVGIYAIKASEVHIGVSILRRNFSPGEQRFEKNDDNWIQLDMGRIQEYTMTPKQKRSSFYFEVTNAENVVINLNHFKGEVAMVVTKEGEGEAVCKEVKKCEIEVA